LLGDLYQQAWLRSNRPYWMHNVTALYDLRTQLWITRADQFRSAIRQYNDSHTLPPAGPDIGLPAPHPAVAPVH
jgi:hypothetical protein